MAHGPKNDWDGPPQHASNLQIKLDGDDTVNLANLSSKNAYKKIMTKSDVSNMAYKRWREEPNQFGIKDQQEWTHICLRPFGSVRETKIQSFQYKLINRISPCRVYLK